MDFYEQVVQYYLTTVAKLFVLPQRVVKPSNQDWKAKPDFLALDFQLPSILVIEVSKERGKKGIEDVALRLKNDSMIIEKVLKEEILAKRLDFPVDWHFYARKHHLEALEQHPVTTEFRNSGRTVKFVALEDVFQALGSQMP